MEIAYVGLGSNQGDRRATIQRAVDQLSALAHVTLLQCSNLQETAPVGGPPQGSYLNGVAKIQTSLTAEALLTQLLEIETQLGRVRTGLVRWSPRPIDLDLLFYGNLICQSSTLTLPHPRLTERLFVLEPLAKLAPQLIHPTEKQTIQALLEKLQSQALV